jgi:hypothetical protein
VRGILSGWFLGLLLQDGVEARESNNGESGKSGTCRAPRRWDGINERECLLRVVTISSSELDG